MAYIILRKSYEYNDEIYENHNDDGGSPVHVYTYLSDAEAAYEKMERKAWRDCSPRDYCYDWNTVTDIPECELSAKVREIFTGSKESFSFSKIARRKFLYKTLGIALQGNALDVAVESAIKEEFSEDEEFDFEFPEDATDKQVDAIRKIFNRLTFYFIKEVETN